jgi:hypothetical protein
MSVSIDGAAAEVQAGTPVRVFQASALQLSREYSVSGDGRFLMNVSVTEQASAPVRVIHNWAAGMRR